jgi:DCN1-like protein 1/2
MFAKYAKGDVMDQDGIEAFFNDLGVNAQTDIVAILVAQYCEAAAMGEFKQAEFVKGCQALGCDNLQAWKDVLKNRLRTELKQEANFAKLYKFTFGFATERGFKNVEVETACALWELFLGSQCQFLKKWVSFLNEEKKDLKVITRDTWDLFYDLVKQTKGDLKNFVDDGAWPSQIDEFILYTQK